MQVPMPRPGQRFGIPADEMPHPRRMAAFLEDRGVTRPGFPSPLWANICRLAVTVSRDADNDGFVLRVGPAPAKLVYCGRAFADPAWANWASFDQGAQTAVFFACAWQVPALRAELQGSVWSALLSPLTQTAADPERPPGRHRGWLRARLHPPGGETARHGLDGALELELIRLGVRDGRPLQPRPAPKSVGALRRQVRCPRPVDVRLMELVEARRGEARGWRGSDATDDALMVALAGEVDVLFDDAPVAVQAAPWPAALVVEDAADGMQLRWETPIYAWWPTAGGYLLDAEHRLWRLPTARADALRALLDHGLPKVPASEVRAFARAFLQRARTPVTVRTDRFAVNVGTPTPRVCVTRIDGRGLVDLTFRYGALELDPEAGALLVTDAGLALRDYAAEADWRLALAEAIGRPVPAEYEGDALFDFLDVTVPGLEGWALDIDRRLLGLVRGTLRPTLGIDAGLDWFNLKGWLEIDGLRISLREVLAAWQSGDRYLALPDGTVAQLPAAWLDQHAEEAQALLALRRLRRGRLRVHDAAAIAGLLEEVPDADAVERWRQIARRLAEFSGVPPVTPPATLQATLRDYQRHGVSWMACLANLDLGGVLADDMGLGKTMQTLAWMLYAKERDAGGGPTLVVAPTSVVHTWVGEAQRFAPSLRVALHHGPKRGPLPVDADVVVTSYAVLRRDAPLLEAVRWQAVILDEAQHIKNARNLTAAIARRLKARHRFALSGTPLENSLGELWSLFEFLMPGFFGTQRGFDDEFARPIQRDRCLATLKRLRARIRPFILRRLKSEVAAELPARTVQVLRCPLPPDHRQVYDDLLDTCRTALRHPPSADDPDRLSLAVLQALTRLRRACCHPQLVPLPQAQRVNRSGKLDALEGLIDQVLAQGRRALIFSQWTSLLTLVRAQLKARGVAHMYLDGSTRERALLQARWNRPDGPPLFLISVRAGGTGLTLTGADVVIHLDPWWNPAIEEQATDRAHRIGQTKPVTVYKLVAEDTIEERVLELQAIKRSLFDATIEADRVDVGRLSRADLEAALSSGPLRAVG